MRASLKVVAVRHFTAFYMCCLLIIAGVATGCHTIFQEDSNRDHALASLFYTTGRQRMLSQRIASLAAEYRLGNLSVREPLLQAAEEFETRQAYLSAVNRADPARDPEILQVRQDFCCGSYPLDKVIPQFAGLARQVASLPPGAPAAEPALAVLFAQARAPLLNHLNDVVELQEERSENALARLRRLDLASLLMILCTLVAEAVFMFRPMIKLIAKRIAEAQDLAATLDSEREKLSVTLRAIGDGVITTDAFDRVTWMNPVAETLTGWSSAQAEGMAIGSVFAIFHDSTGQPAPSPTTLCLAENRIAGLATQTMLRSQHGDVRAVEDSAAPIRQPDGAVIGAVLVFRDVTQQRKLAGEMTYRATHDMLTGLLNRQEFDHRLAFSLRKADSDQMPGALLLIDLDQFKLVNDKCGHAAGDQLLVQVAKLLISMVRASDSVARLGGDEFAVLLDRCPMSNAQELGQKICDQLEGIRFIYEEQRFAVGASIGLAPLDGRWADTAALMHAADSCCYAAKLAGRNRLHTWSETDQGMRARHGEVHWAARLEQALDDNQFVLYAQRIHGIGNAKRGLHAEILVRMSNPDGSLLPPGAFLPAAERFHMAPRLDRWVLTNALAWMRAAPSLETIDMLAINLSGQSIGDAAFQRWVLAELADAGPNVARRICLEITETAAVTNLADASAFIQQLKNAGVRVALDDFGAGASSFGYLKSLAVDFLKIDGQFVRDILTDKLDDAMVRCLVEIAAVVGMCTIAEYTESAEIMERLRDIGVDFAQGYHVHRPAPIEELMIAHAPGPETAVA